MKGVTAKNISLFVLRTVLGIIFVLHGAQKLFGMFGGVGLEGTSKMMEGLGFVYPHIFAVIWSSIEFFGGVFLVLGIVSRYMSILLIALMLISIWKINMAYGFFVQNGGYEYHLLIIAANFPIVFLGGGSWSLWDV